MAANVIWPVAEGVDHCLLGGVRVIVVFIDVACHRDQPIIRRPAIRVKVVELFGEVERLVDRTLVQHVPEQAAFPRCEVFVIKQTLDRLAAESVLIQPKHFFDDIVDGLVGVLGQVALALHRFGCIEKRVGHRNLTDICAFCPLGLSMDALVSRAVDHVEDVEQFVLCCRL